MGSTPTVATIYHGDIMTKDQFDRLPKFAQQSIERLRRENDRLREELHSVTDKEVPTNIRWGWKHFEDSAFGYLPNTETLFFTIPDERGLKSCVRVNISPEGDSLYINGDKSIALTFQASNAFKVKMGA